MMSKNANLENMKDKPNLLFITFQYMYDENKLKNRPETDKTSNKMIDLQFSRRLSSCVSPWS